MAQHFKCVFHLKKKPTLKVVNLQWLLKITKHVKIDKNVCGKDTRLRAPVLPE